MGSGKKTSIKKLVYILSKKLNRKIEITYEKKDITDMELTHASLKKSILLSRRKRSDTIHNLLVVGIDSSLCEKV